MKSIKKITALLLVLIMCMCLGACSDMPRTTQKEWSFKADGKEYPVGAYVFPLVNAYEFAYNYLSHELGDKFNPDESILNLVSSFDEAGKSYVCRDYVLKQAEDYMKLMIAIDTLCAEHGVAPLDIAVDNATQQAKNDWYLGDITGEMSGYAEALPAKNIYEEYGIGFESYYLDVYESGRKGIKQDALFSRIYGKDGEKAVSEQDLKAFFEKDFTCYRYFLVPLYETATDSVTGELTNQPMESKKRKEIQDKLLAYEEQIKKGVHIDSVERDFMDYSGFSAENFYMRLEKYSDVGTTLDKEMEQTLRKMNEREGKAVFTGQEDTPIAVFLYKDTITDKTDDIIENSTDYITLVRELKNEEFFELIVSKAETVDFEVNSSVLESFSPEFVEKIYKK